MNCFAKFGYETLDGMIHIHIGMVNGAYAGPTQSQFSVPTAINLEYEFLNSSKNTRYLRTLMALDQAQGTMDYFLVAYGGRYYFNSQAKMYNLSKNGESYSLLPKKRYFYGWDAGIANVLVQKLGTVFTTYSTMFDLGFHIGYSYHIKPSWALEAIFGYSYGYGFSTIAVTGTTMRMMFGGSYYY